MRHWALIQSLGETLGAHTIASGTNMVMYRTDGHDYVDVTINGKIYRITFDEYNFTDPYDKSQTINELPIRDYFDYLPYGD